MHPERAASLPLDGGRLVAVCWGHTGDERLIESLARWRAANADVFPTRFPVTVDGTATWLAERVLAVPNRMMFLVVAPDGEPIGHAGLADADPSTAKVDNVLRGVPRRVPGIMSAAVATLIRWSGAELLHLPVFVWNRHAIRFYRRLGFRDDTLLPLTRMVDGPQVTYVPFDSSRGTAPDDYHLRMVYDARAPAPRGDAPGSLTAGRSPAETLGSAS